MKLRLFPRFSEDSYWSALITPASLADAIAALMGPLGRMTKASGPAGHFQLPCFNRSDGRRESMPNAGKRFQAQENQLMRRIPALELGTGAANRGFCVWKPFLFAGGEGDRS